MEGQVENISNELKWEHLLDRTMFQLSGGEKQKIACASVSVTDNPIIVLDEPSSNLNRNTVAGAIASLRNDIVFDEPTSGHED